MRVVAVMMALMVCGVATAATINVPGDYSTIQAAVDAASNGDVILVSPGTYTSSHPGHVVDTRGKAIAIRSTGGAAVTTINGEGERLGLACFSGEVDSTIVEGFTIKSCSSSDYDYTNNGFISNWERSGGGILCHESSPTISGCDISGNTAADGGGIYCSGGSPTISGCTISGNTAHYGEAGDAFFGGRGGGICCNGGSPTITGCTITNNTGDHAGGIYCSYSSPTITDCTITGNTDDSDEGGEGGGGIYCDNSSPTISGCDISGNTAADGGGISCSGGRPTISGCTISGNTAHFSGGGINGDTFSPTISGCTISNNTANEGGGIYFSESNSTLSNTIVCGNVLHQIYGYYSDEGGNTISATCEAECDADVAGNDQMVDGEDLYVILSLWNQEVHAINIDGDGIIGITDLLMLLEAWGPCA